MALSFNDTIANQILQALADLFDVGVDTITVYGGTPPTNANTALGTQPVLAAITLPAPGMGLAASRSVAKEGTWADNSIDATGTASFFRLVDSGGGIVQGTVTGTGGGGDMTVDNINFTAGGTFTITGFSFTFPAA